MPSLYSSEHEDFRKTARTFFEREVIPFHDEWEKDGIVPRDLWLKAGAAGLLCFDVAEECATPVLCDASIAYSGIRGSPRCVRPKCEIGQHRCSDTGVLELCNQDRTDYQANEECIGPPFCSAVA